MCSSARSRSAPMSYLDAVQVEVIQPGETYSTYIDGDQAGPIPNQGAAGVWLEWHAARQYELSQRADARWGDD